MTSYENYGVDREKVRTVTQLLQPGRLEPARAQLPSAEHAQRLGGLHGDG
jgi:hypothetical protein